MGFNFTYVVLGKLLQGLLWLVSFKLNFRRENASTPNTARYFNFIFSRTLVSDPILLMLCVGDYLDTLVKKS